MSFRKYAVRFQIHVKDEGYLLVKNEMIVVKIERTDCPFLLLQASELLHPLSRPQKLLVIS